MFYIQFYVDIVFGTSAVSFFLITVYILYFSLIKNKNAFPLSSELRKTLNSFSNIATFVPRHRHIRLSVSYSFGIPLIIYRSFRTPSIFYLIGSSYTLNIDIALTLKHRPRHQSYIDLSFTQHTTYHTTPGRVTHQLALLDFVIVVFVLVSDHIDIASISVLKYHQNFMKSDLQFKYNGKVQISLFKKWYHEIHDWVKDGQLGSRCGIWQSGKYLSGKAYRFYEQEILQNEEMFTFTKYFAALFDYIFPADFCMQQRDEFDSCHQEDLLAVDYLRQLQDLADTVGDLEDADVVLAFWRRCQSYIRSELTHTRYEPSILTVDDLETLANCIKHAEEVSCYCWNCQEWERCWSNEWCTILSCNRGRSEGLIKPDWIFSGGLAWYDPFSDQRRWYGKRTWYWSPISC